MAVTVAADPRMERLRTTSLLSVKRKDGSPETAPDITFLEKANSLNGMSARHENH
jgi:hypothetical protein